MRELLALTARSWHAGFEAFARWRAPRSPWPSSMGTWGSVGLGSWGPARLSAFFVPAGSVIPLHDHPGMRVATRLVEGRLRLRSLDWVPGQGAGWAEEHPEVELHCGDVALLGPRRRNLHELEAVEDVQFVDLFAPDYGPGRVCTYYARVEARDGLVRLAPVRL